MYGLTTIKGLMKRGGLAAFALLISLAALAAPAQAQNGISGPDFQFQADATVGLARGQTVRLRIAATNNQGKLIVGVDDAVLRAGAGAIAHVKVFDGRTGATLQISELTIPTEELRWIDINRDDLRTAGEPRTGRVQLLIKIVVDPPPGGHQGHGKVTVSPPTFEVMDNYSGRTTVQGGVWKTTNFLTFTQVMLRQDN